MSENTKFKPRGIIEKLPPPGETIRVKIGDKPAKEVLRSVYAAAKARQLREFGYPSLTLNEVDEQITALLAGKEFGDGLTVIGMFMEREVLPK